MRRDLDLVRDILIQVGEADGPVDYEELGNGRPAALVAYHCVLMAQRGLLFWRSVNLTGNQTLRRAGERRHRFWRSVNLTGNQT